MKSASALLIGFWILACSGDPVRQSLIEVPAPPGLEEMDSPVQEQYRQRRDALQAALDDRGLSAEDLAGTYGELGMWYHAYRMPDGAKAAYRNALRLAPNGRWAYYLGRLQVVWGEDDEARGSFEVTVEHNPGYVPALVGAADLELRRGEIETARALYERALERAPDCARALAGLGEIALESGDPATAADYLERARLQQPEATTLLQPLGLAYRGLGDRERAREYLERAPAPMKEQVGVTVQDPWLHQVHELRRDGRHYAQKALAAMKAGRLPAAVEGFRKALESDPDRLETRINLGIALRRSGWHRQALAEFREVLARDPEHAGAHSQTAITLEREGDFEKAEQHLRAALEADPDFKEVHVKLGRYLQSQGKPEESLRHVDRVLELDPQHAPAHFVRATSLLRLARFEETRDALEKAVEQLPEAGELRRLLVRLLATVPAVRDGRRAVELAKALEKPSVSLAEAETMAMAHAAAGDFSRAVAWQEAALAAVGSRAPWVAERLDFYRRGQPCPRPRDRRERPLKVRVTAPK